MQNLRNDDQCQGIIKQLEDGMNQMRSGKNERVYQVIQSNLKGYESKQPDNVQQWHTILPDA